MRVEIAYYSMDGNLEIACSRLADELRFRGAEVRVSRLVCTKPYPASGPLKFLAGGRAALTNEEPALEPYELDEQADVVVLGTPVWAGRVAPALNTLLREHDLSACVVAAVISSASGNADSCARDLADKLGRPLSVLPVLPCRNPKGGQDEGFASRVATFAAALVE